MAGPMWAEAMRAIQDDLPDETSRHRSGSTEEQIQVEIPDVIGMSTRRAAERLAGAGFYVSIGDRRSSDERPGTRRRDEPGRRRARPRGSTVDVYPSSG